LGRLRAFGGVGGIFSGGSRNWCSIAAVSRTRRSIAGALHPLVRTSALLQKKASQKKKLLYILARHARTIAKTQVSGRICSSTMAPSARALVLALFLASASAFSP